MELNRKNIIKILLVAGCITFFYWGLQNLMQLSSWISNIVGIFMPVLVGIGLAFIFNVPMRGIEKNLFNKSANKTIEKIKRPVSLLLSICLVVVVILMVLFIIIPELGRTVATIRDSIPGFLIRMQEWTNELMVYFPEWGAEYWKDIDWVKIGEKMLAILQSGVTNVLSSTFTIVTTVFSGMVNFILGFVLSIYILSQKEKLTEQFKKIMYAVFKEEKADRYLYVLRLTNKAFINFFTGQCLEAIIIGLLFFVSMSLFKFPYALMVSVIIGFTALIPVFGAFLGCLISVFFIVVTAPIKAVWFLVLFIVIQQLEGNLIYPRVVGGSVGLPGIWVLLAVTLGGSLMGVVGMLIMVPLSSVIYTLTGEFTNQRIKSKRISAEKISSK
ncbi:MAG: AI-2E family transporter [Cellulosilyticaceae bacterium]